MILTGRPPSPLDERWAQQPRTFALTTALGILAGYGVAYLVSQSLDFLGYILFFYLLATVLGRRHLWETYAELPATELLLRYRWDRRFLARRYCIDLAWSAAVHGAGITGLWFAGLVGIPPERPAALGALSLPPLVCLSGSTLLHAMVGLHHNLRTWIRIPGRHRSTAWPYDWGLMLVWILFALAFLVLLTTAPLMVVLLPVPLAALLVVVLPEVESPRSLGSERPVRGETRVRSHSWSPWRALLWNGLTREGRLLVWSLVGCTLITAILALAGSWYCIPPVMVGLVALLAACFWSRRWFIWDPWRSAPFLDGHGLELGRMLRILLMAHLAGALIFGTAILVLMVLAPANAWLGLILLWFGVAPALAWHSLGDVRVWLGIAITVALGWWVHESDSAPLATVLEGLGLVTWIAGLVWCVVTAWRTRDEQALRHQLLGRC